jgi:predicted transcriptional regulator
VAKWLTQLPHKQPIGGSNPPYTTYKENNIMTAEITAEEIQETRDKWGLSLMEAKSFIRTKRAILEMKELSNNGSVEEKVDYLLKLELNSKEEFFHEKWGRYGFVIEGEDA